MCTGIIEQNRDNPKDQVNTALDSLRKISASIPKELKGGPDWPAVL
jgi:hypothetical protein